MKYADNILEVAGLEPDLMGFIFHSASPRYVGDALDARLLQSLPATLRKVGVFVDETTDFIRQQTARYGLDVVQLHGHETPAQCAELQAAGLAVIKAFSVGEELDPAALAPYAPYCTYFLFDTKGPRPGGNGTPFNWELLRAYDLPVPYLLAGGLKLDNVDQLLALQLPGLYGLDLNSQFETAPAVKDPERLRLMLRRLGRTGTEKTAR